MTTMDSALSARPSPWASRIAVAAVHFFVLVLFLHNMEANTWAAILGLLVAHVYSFVILMSWGNLERTTAGDTAIVALTLEYMLIAIMFWDRFSLWPWSTFVGLIVVQVCALLGVRFWKGLRKAPPTAWFGMVIILLYVIVAATAPVIAPFTETEIVGSEYEEWGEKFLLGTDNLGRDWLTRLIYGARNTIGIAFVTTCLAFLIGALGGFLSAALGGWVDQILGRIVDVLMAIPSLIFALLLLSIFKDYSILGISIHPMVLLVVIIAVLDSTRVFRLARAVGMNIVVMDYVEVSRLRGEGLWLVRDNATLISFGDITPLLPAAAIALLTIGVNFVVDWFLHQTSGLRDDH
jgi:peptide/nickel transport system permease protein